MTKNEKTRCADSLGNSRHNGSEDGFNPIPKDSLPQTGNQYPKSIHEHIGAIKTPTEQREEAEAWIAKNAEAYRELINIALWHTEKGLVCQFDGLVFLARYRWRSVKGLEGDPYKINNNIIPAIKRVMIEQHPELKSYLPIRPAKCDKAFEGGVDNGE